MMPKALFVSHKPREMRGPIETPIVRPGHNPRYQGHKPREMRGPIETGAVDGDRRRLRIESQAARNARPY